jgi:hypothetical protein
MRRVRLFVAAALVGSSSVSMVAVPSGVSSAATTACVRSTSKCVTIDASPLVVTGGVDGQAITYTILVDPGAPGPGLGSGSIQPVNGSGLTFIAVSGGGPQANCFISPTGAATCLNLNTRPGQTFIMTVDVNVACTASGGPFSMLWSGSETSPQKGDQFLIDPASDGLIETVTPGPTCP